MRKMFQFRCLGLFITAFLGYELVSVLDDFVS